MLTYIIHSLLGYHQEELTVFLCHTVYTLQYPNLLPADAQLQTTGWPYNSEQHHHPNFLADGPNWLNISRRQENIAATLPDNRPTSFPAFFSSNTSPVVLLVTSSMKWPSIHHPTLLVILRSSKHTSPPVLLIPIGRLHLILPLLIHQIFT